MPANYDSAAPQLRGDAGSNAILRGGITRRATGLINPFGPVGGRFQYENVNTFTRNYARSVGGKPIPTTADPLSPRSKLGGSLYGRRAPASVPINVVVNVQT